MKRFIAYACAAAVLMLAGSAFGAQVPKFINFQSVLLDDGGNLLPDGGADLTFRITDISGTVLYEEYQKLEVAHGAVSAMVGNGTTSDGAPTGGVPMNIFAPDEGRYLEVVVEGHPSQGTFEIVSVPYALYAQEALSVADGVVDGTSLAEGSVTVSHLAPDVIEELGNSTAADGGVVNWSSIQSSSGASNVGVQSGLSFTDGSNMQEALQDLDASRTQRTSEVDTLLSQLEAADNTESQTRAQADSGLQSQIGERVSRSGDTMNGDLTICSDLNVGEAGGCSGDLYVNGDSVAQQIQQNQQDVAATRALFANLKVIAWGTVDGQGALVDGHNVTMGSVVLGDASYTIDFIAQPTSAAYAALVTCQIVGLGQCLSMTQNKTAASFVVRTAKDSGSFVALSFDFIVLGRDG